MNETPKHWILNPMCKLFEVIPKKLKPLEENNIKKEETFVLNQLAWIPRSIKMTPRLIRRLSNDLKNKYNVKDKYKAKDKYKFNKK